MQQPSSFTLQHTFDPPQAVHVAKLSIAVVLIKSPNINCQPQVDPKESERWQLLL